ncbi:acyl-CoA thioesterase [Streptomyces sp. DSM 44917]|uniref:Acyl-CoA thioesterase n=1 Tax=Streptomyces boetiae TaxID=3075541 RepID=A0ABU2L3D3_9ACTN|nr:acyl-CoA thioesterase [Streptomyces sp. DSM 44917]MDT0306030.1 acyl-CoA thioesterase [Streptomyces sp. DSM 44917]
MTTTPSAPSASSGAPFAVRVTVRGYETDTQGHLNQAVYLQYCEHARWSLLEAAGIRQADLLAQGIGPVVLENRIRYHRELRAGDEVDVSCAFTWGGGKVFRIEQRITTAEGETSAELTSVGGILDLKTRRLVADPLESFRTLTKSPLLLPEG